MTLINITPDDRALGLAIGVRSSHLGSRLHFRPSQLRIFDRLKACGFSARKSSGYWKFMRDGKTYSRLRAYALAREEAK